MTEVLEFLQQETNWPYNTAMIIFLGLIAFQLLSLGGDFFDADVGGDDGGEFFKVPVMVFLPPLFGIFGISGWTINWMLRDSVDIDRLWTLLITLPVSTLISFYATRTVIRFLPTAEQSFGLETSSLKDCQAEVISLALNSQEGRVIVTDNRGILFKVQCRMLDGFPEAKHGEAVMIVKHVKGADICFAQPITAVSSAESSEAVKE